MAGYHMCQGEAGFDFVCRPCFSAVATITLAHSGVSARFCGPRTFPYSPMQEQFWLGSVVGDRWVAFDAVVVHPKLDPPGEQPEEVEPIVFSP